MADYWKSNPRKFCEVCKCWFADNKASIEFHEGGRRHQANVSKQLKQARLRSVEDAKEKLNVAKTLSAIEQAAFNAYQQDLGGGKVKKAKLPVAPEVQQFKQLKQYVDEEQDAIERLLEKKKIEVHAQQKVQEIQTKATLEAAYNAYSSYLTQSIPVWQQCYSPEGYVYYYNSVNGVSQWEVPTEYQPPFPPPPPPQPQPQFTTPTASATLAPSPDTTPINHDSLKRMAQVAELEERDIIQPPKRRGPYGGWTTVAIKEREEEEKEESAEGEGTEEEKDRDVTDGGKVQFEEKTLSVRLGEDEESNEMKGEFKGFSFKKRTNKPRPQTRQRTSDI